MNIQSIYNKVIALEKALSTETLKGADYYRKQTEKWQSSLGGKYYDGYLESFGRMISDVDEMKIYLEAVFAVKKDGLAIKAPILLSEDGCYVDDQSK